MASKKGINPVRLMTIMKRQAEPRWGSGYIPSILATSLEAPSLSHACTLNSEKLGREVHCLSLSETAAALLALYHPGLVELHEQKMLSPGATPHPLVGFPGLHRVGMPEVRGLIDVADRLGYLHLLPKVRIEDPENPGSFEYQVFPYIGDLLLFMRGSGDHLYCVNWNIKDQETAFRTSFLPGIRKRRAPHENSTEILARHVIEETYYSDAAIRTVRIAGDQIDWHLVANLKELFLNHRIRLSIDPATQREMLDQFRNAMHLDTPPLSVATHLCTRSGISPHVCRTVLLQSIWRRELRVDLFKPILFDKPLMPEKQDVLEVYAEWFKEA